MSTVTRAAAAAAAMTVQMIKVWQAEGWCPRRRQQCSVSNACPSLWIHRFCSSNVAALLQACCRWPRAHQHLRAAARAGAGAADASAAGTPARPTPQRAPSTGTRRRWWHRMPAATGHAAHRSPAATGASARGGVCSLGSSHGAQGQATPLISLENAQARRREHRNRRRHAHTRKVQPQIAFWHVAALRWRGLPSVHLHFGQEDGRRSAGGCIGCSGRRQRCRGGA